MIYLGVDVGFKHFGISLADGPLARPLPSFLHRSLEDSVAHLLSLATNNGVDAIVLGLPEGKVAELTHSLHSSLSKHPPLTIILHSESLSTKDAIGKLREIGASRKKLQNDHSYAACLILEDYLESLD